MKQLRGLIAEYEELRKKAPPSFHADIDKNIKEIKWRNFWFDLLDIFLKTGGALFFVMGIFSVIGGAIIGEFIPLISGAMTIYFSLKMFKGIDE